VGRRSSAAPWIHAASSAGNAADTHPIRSELDALHPMRAGRGHYWIRMPTPTASQGSGRTGAEPDLLDEVAWWQTDDFWQYAMYTAAAYLRAAANRAGVPARQACQELTRRPARPPG
jgi:hypothetical protein